MKAMRHVVPALALIISMMPGVVSCKAAKREAAEQTPSSDILGDLMAGNEQFVIERMPRKDLASGQAPSAVILTCSDSRVAPEVLFGHGLGDIFVVRVAGNVSNVENIASIEYAVEHLNSKLIMVMGHESCGAVEAAVKGIPDGQAAMRNLGALVRNIRSNIAESDVSLEPIPDDPTYRKHAVANVQGVIKDIIDQSDIISRAINDGTVAVVPAMFSLATGKVELLSP